MPGGRPKGARNRKTVEQAEAVKASGLTPLDYLLSILRDTQKGEDVRIDAAKAAAPYVHPRLANIDAHITGQISIGAALDALDDD